MKKIIGILLSVGMFWILCSASGVKAEYSTSNVHKTSRGSSIGIPEFVSGMVTVEKEPNYFGGILKKASSKKFGVHFRSGLGEAEYYMVAIQSFLAGDYVTVGCSTMVYTQDEAVPASEVIASTTIDAGLLVRLEYWLDDINDMFDEIDSDEAYLTFYTDR